MSTSAWAMRTFGLFLRARSTAVMNDICAEAGGGRTDRTQKHAIHGTKDADHTSLEIFLETGLQIMVSLFLQEPCIALRAGA